MFVFLTSIGARCDFVLLNKILLCSCPFDSCSFHKLNKRDGYLNTHLFYLMYEVVKDVRTLFEKNNEDIYIPSLSADEVGLSATVSDLVN